MTVAEADEEIGRAIIDALSILGSQASTSQLTTLIHRHQKSDRSTWTKSELLRVLERSYCEHPDYGWLKQLLRKTPIRSLSGITSITVLTKPFPCPGKCIFCPVDVRMPKSYIATEPGAMRAGKLGFDPYQQVYQRLRAYSDMGHPISKIELIVLGGTWSAYPQEYQRWFILRLFEALNDFGVRMDDSSASYETDWHDRIVRGETYDAHINASQYVRRPHAESATWEQVEEAQRINETANCRSVGLSLETRPDLVNVEECTSLRALGATKIQIGLQSLDDNVLRLNKRGHKVAQAENALRLLRRFGFKIHAHWMPNLYGSNPEADMRDYDRLFDNLSIRPDELKIYPTSLIADTELEGIAERGLWQPYTEEELTDVLAHALTHTPEYCRLTRVIRDIPSSEILAGNKKGNLRQIVEGGIEASLMHDIRAREIKGDVVVADDLTLDRLVYETAETVEHFLQFIRPADRKIAAFLRLSLPKAGTRQYAPVEELSGCALLREVHVYGQSVRVGEGAPAAQHQGLGRKLIAEAAQLAREAEFERLAVISAVGTRKYYEKQGFSEARLYQHLPL